MFNNNDIYYIWDILFSYKKPLELLNHICVTLMILPRTKIYGGDSLDAFQIFFNYPTEYSIPFIMQLSILSYQKDDLIFTILEQKEKKEKPKKKIIEIDPKELSLDSATNIDTDGIYTRIVFIQDSLLKAIENMPFVHYI